MHRTTAPTITAASRGNGAAAAVLHGMRQGSRNLAVDEETGAVTVGAGVRPGQTVRLQVREAESAHDDLVHALGRQVAALGRPPAGALLFTCNGRGAQMFGTPGHDAQAVADAFVGAPTAGFFCAGEIGPVGGRNYVHGFTATLAVFPS